MNYFNNVLLLNNVISVRERKLEKKNRTKKKMKQTHLTVIKATISKL